MLDENKCKYDLCMSTKQETEQRPAGLYKKLLALQTAVRSLMKDQPGGGDRNGFWYVSGAKLLSVVRPRMDELGLILKQEVISEKHEPITYRVNGKMPYDKTEMFTAVDMRFTWIDVDSGEKDENVFHANGMNAWDKGLGSALTYGERYFLLKFFHIATDEDDVDALPVVEAVLSRRAETEAPSRYVQIGDNTYLKMWNRIQKGELDTVEKALAAGFTFEQTARDMLEQAQRDYKPKNN